MIKKIIALSLWILLFSFQGFAQRPDGNFDNLTFNQLTKGNGASDYSGWGINTDNTIDPRPNYQQGMPLMINNHTGLTFSAHLNYGGIRFYNQGYPIGPLVPSTGAVMVMSINNNAVGVGTVNPRVPLDVGVNLVGGKLGTVLARLPEGDATGEGTFLGVRGYNTTTDYGFKSFALEHSFYGVTNSSVNFLRGGSTEGGSITFNTNKNIEQVRIDASGNVGIGTSSPREKLSVNGNIRAKAIKVENANWPDYVFEPAYEKLSLPELEKFIQTNKHLPEVPSAKTVAKDGIDLSDMNAKLLKKIEELTLYMIEQQKMIQSLKERVEVIERPTIRNN